MKLVTVLYQGKEVVGVLSGEEVLLLEDYASMEDLIRRGLPEVIPKEGVSLSKVKLLAPIPRPSHDVICLGMNFADHTVEAARFHPNMVRENFAVYFSKRVNQAVAPNDPICLHEDLTSTVDYEAEVAFIIGKDAYQVPAEKAKDYVFGYTILNDVSARDLQNRHKQFYFGKSLDGFTPIGPCIVTADEFSFPPALRVTCHINDELRQDGNTSQWIYGIEEVIWELSSGMTLEAGTIITMGTPAGVGMGFTPPKYLKSGDVVRCEVEGIGVLENPAK